MEPNVVPPSPFGVKLIGRRQMAKYYLGRDDERACRRITALCSEVAPASRIPHGRSGGQPFSYTGWLDDFDRKQAKHLVDAA